MRGSGIKSWNRVKSKTLRLVVTEKTFPSSAFMDWRSAWQHIRRCRYWITGRVSVPGVSHTKTRGVNPACLSQNTQQHVLHTVNAYAKKNIFKPSNYVLIATNAMLHAYKLTIFHTLSKHRSGLLRKCGQLTLQIKRLMVTRKVRAYSTSFK